MLECSTPSKRWPVRALYGDRLAIMTNGGGPGVMATDALVLGGGKLASLSDDTIEQLDLLLPSTWSRGNPVDIIGDAPVERIRRRCRRWLRIPELMRCYSCTRRRRSFRRSRLPTHACLSPPGEAAQRLVLSCWLGGDGLEPARDVSNPRAFRTTTRPSRLLRRSCSWLITGAIRKR